ncbi:hypothetical protein BDV26DRAFT_265283 [Aspergillus bertholletiae]|uniref:Uncharacterized protein n=1 Tax=Aspergillus bertholletiae TaxID=1226010 RepID=A0A5N7B389_9EURO|nr:hypothetical protein BDV26DRAFT_265283 [Aspergillus bertholletiae]
MFLPKVPSRHFLLTGPKPKFCCSVVCGYLVISCNATEEPVRSLFGPLMMMMTMMGPV